MAELDEQKREAAPKEEEQKETTLESIAGMMFVLVCGLFVLTFVAQNFEIPSSSMEPTMLIGDHLVVDHATLAPPTKWMPLVHYRPLERGDIIVFLKPHPEQPDFILVKRTIGLPGDRIHLQHGVLYRNGVALSEPQISMPDNSDGEHYYSPYRDDFPAEEPTDMNVTSLWAQELPSHIQNGDLVVPDGMVFAMGDNRVASLDSRYWGFVPRENILGRPLFVYWSFMTPADQINKTTAQERVAFFVHIITHIFTETRWSRTFHKVV